MKLSRSEQKAYDLLVVMHPEQVSIDGVANAMYLGRKRPVNWRGSALAIMRSLMLKSQVLPGMRRVERSSRLGPGSPATYELI